MIPNSSLMTKSVTTNAMSENKPMLDTYSNMAVNRYLNAMGRHVRDNHPNINFGGCCVFAAKVAAELEKRNIQVSGIVASWGASSWSRNTIELIRNNPKINFASVHAWNDAGIYLDHVGIEFVRHGARYHYDTNGAKLAGKYFDAMCVYDGRLSVDELQALAKDQGGWNPAFDRGQIEEVHIIIDTYMSALDQAAAKYHKKKQAAKPHKTAYNAV